MSPVTPTSLATVTLEALPAILALIRASHVKANPAAPELTDAEVIAALHSAVASSVAIDEQWLHDHRGDTGE